MSLLEETIVSNIYMPEKSQPDFIDWQSKLHGIMASFPGFVSLEISSSSDSYWRIVQRFQSVESVNRWRNSKERTKLLDELKSLSNDIRIVDEGSDAFKQGGVTEVFVTEVIPEKEIIFKKWLAKIHNLEARFPGFRGLFVQAPTEKSRYWLTFLQFDSAKNLDHWLASDERQLALEESKELIKHLESHRLISPYAGWFASIAKETGTPPSAWKQTMVVLLVLFPIVMLEIRYLNPWLTSFNISLATFIGNAISVSLVSWPLVPLAIRFLRFWLVPQPEKKREATLYGTALVLLLYALSIAIFWKLMG
jgi:uncharacterized protein